MVQRIAHRYAKSLLDLGVEQKNIETISQDMETISTALENRDLKMLVKSPIIKPDKKISILKKIFEGNVDKVTMAFLEIVTRKGREAMLPELATSFKAQYKKLNHVSSVKLTTATVVTEKALEEIKSNLLKSAVTDEKVEIETAVDPELIGGFVLEIGDKLYDASVAYQLDQVKKKFADNKYIKSY